MIDKIEQEGKIQTLKAHSVLITWYFEKTNYLTWKASQ